MKNLSIFVTALMVAVFMGISCSHGERSVTEPSFLSESVSMEMPSDENAQIIGSWTASIDIENMEITVTENRDLANFNFTNYLSYCEGGCLKFFLREINGKQLHLEAQLTNPTTISPYDTRIILTNLDGKRIVNPDGYTSLFDPPGGEPHNPYYYFYLAHDPDRRFPAGPGSYIIRNDVLVDFESYTSWNFNVIASCGLFQHVRDVVQKTSFNTNGIINSSGGTLQVQVGLLDWQNDIAFATLHASELEGANVPLTYNPSNGLWECELHNSMGVKAGIYRVLVSAYSQNEFTAYFCDFVDIPVAHQPGAEQLGYYNVAENMVHIIWSDLEGVPYRYQTEITSNHPYLTGNKEYVYSSSLNYPWGRNQYLHKIGDYTKTLWALGTFGGASDDGRVAAYEYNSRIWVLTSWAGTYNQLSSSIAELSPCVSGDGSRVMYISYDNGEADIAYRNVSSLGNEYFPIPSNQLAESEPVLTYDGNTVYMLAQTQAMTGYDVYKYVISTNTLTQITDTPNIREKDVQTSADGSKVIFLRETGTSTLKYNVFVYREGMAPSIIQITSDAGGQVDYMYPEINSSGTMILYNRWDQSILDCKYYLANSEGSDLKLIQTAALTFPMSFNAY